jgi:hypothetical protein
MKMTFKNGIVVEGTPEELERVARWGLTGQEVQPEQPKYREVKRPAKVGERIRVVNATITGGNYKNGDEFTVLETKETGGVIVETSSGRMYISFVMGEYVVLEPIEGAEDGKTEEPTEQEASSRLKVGDYARVVQAGHPNFGKIVRITLNDREGRFIYKTEHLDGKSADVHAESQLVAATAEEIDEAKRKLFAKGDYVELLSGGGNFPLFGFSNGGIYVVRDTNYSHSRGKRIEITTDNDDGRGYATPDQLRKLTPEEAAARREQTEEPKKGRPKVGQYVRILTDEKDLPKGSIAEITEDDEDHLSFLCVSLDDSNFDYCREDEIEVIPANEVKWAAIGRKVGEKRKGDLVRVTNACGAPVKVGGVYEVEDEYVGEGNSAYIEGGWAVICELVCPVEQRFDKTE